SKRDALKKELKPSQIPKDLRAKLTRTIRRRSSKSQLRKRTLRDNKINK
ncbi:UNVERIFIED_CONTAM: hypothetical protein GTU68_056462, partial [Idotea baltica]|nr:hypothetical protein [Idotea baltica]